MSNVWWIRYGYPMSHTHGAPIPDFRHLFRGDRFRFEFGVRTAEFEWFQLPSDASDRLEERQSLIAASPDRHLPWSAEADPLLDEVCSLFPPSDTVGSGLQGGDRAKALASRWEPDFVLMRGSPSGFHMVGACVCDPSWWDPADKLGKPLEAIHSPVPTLNTALGDRIRIFLERLPVGPTLVRENWGLAAVPDRNLHPALDRPRLDATSRVSTTWIRVEHQAFRALPKSGGVAFLIWLTVHPLAEVLRDPVVAEGFRRQLVSMPPEIARYKGLEHLGPAFWEA